MGSWGRTEPVRRSRSVGGHQVGVETGLEHFIRCISEICIFEISFYWKVRIQQNLKPEFRIRENSARIWSQNLEFGRIRENSARIWRQNLENLTEFEGRIRENSTEFEAFRGNWEPRFTRVSGTSCDKLVNIMGNTDAYINVLHNQPTERSFEMIHL